jgi:hypothetical protein
MRATEGVFSNSLFNQNILQIRAIPKGRFGVDLFQSQLYCNAK